MIWNRVFLIAFEANMDLSLSREFYIIFNTLYGFGIRSKVKNTIRRTSVQELCPHPAVASTVQTGTSDIALLDPNSLRLSSSKYASTRDDGIRG
jgi:hypothetical protein